MKKVILFSGLIMAPIVAALAVWLASAVVTAERSADFLSAFEKIHESKTALTVAQVEGLMGQPTRIVQSESADQTVTAAVYHYPTYPPGGDFQVVFVNGVVFSTELPAPAKS